MMIKEWLEKQGMSFWWKVAIALVLTGTIYENASNAFSDHEQRTKNIETSADLQKKSLDQLSQDAKSTKEIMQQMLRVSKAACLNTAKNDQARLACIGE